MNLATAPVSRNAQCPCGSGRRYKDCHGSIAANRAAPQPRSGAGSSQPHPPYRPSGADWDLLSDTDRALCSVLMQRALKRQRAGQLVQAAALYEQVLSVAPDTHDALHMLGAIELQRGQLATAKGLMLAALKLRKPYPEIERNLGIVEESEEAARIGKLPPDALPEELCERALPALVELALRPRSDVDPLRGGTRQHVSGRPVHLIAGVRDSSDGAAWLFRRLHALLASERPTVWANDAENVLAASAGKRGADPADVPRGGCHVFVGTDVAHSEWLDRGDAERIVVFCQPAAPSQLLHQLRAISRDGSRPVELVFPSHAMAARFGTGHAVLPPPISVDVEPVAQNSPAPCSSPRSFSVGLIGANWQGKTPAEDGDFLRALAVTAGRVELYDPGPLRYVVGGNPAIFCRSRGAGVFGRLLRSLSCILHTDGQWWLEGDGRELFMAMAAGVVVLCPRSSIFAEYVEHGVDGMLYEGRQESLAHLDSLRKSPSRCIELGNAARAKIAALVAPERVVRSVYRFVLSEPAPFAHVRVPVADEPLTAK